MKIALIVAAFAAALAGQGLVTTVAGAGGRGIGEAQLSFPGGVALDAQDNLYIADSYNHRILKMTPDGVMTTLLGTGVAGKGDNELFFPRTVALDRAGNVYVADSYNLRVQKLATDGKVTTIAGRGGLGNELSQLNFPRGVAVDGIGNVFASDSYNHRVLRVTPEGVNTIAAGGRGMGSEATQLNFPSGVAADASGTLFVADYLNHRVQKVAPGGTTATVAGIEGAGQGRNQLEAPVSVDVDQEGNVFVSDTFNHRIQKVTPKGEVNTVAGGLGEGPAEFQLSQPFDTAVDSLGNLYIADTYNHRIQKVTYPATNASPQLRHAATNRPGPGSPNLVMRLSPAQVCPNPLTVWVGGYRAEVNGDLFTIPEAVDPNVATEVYVLCQARNLLPMMTLTMAPTQPRLFTNWASQALAEIADSGTVIDSKSPVKAGALISLFGTGFGALDVTDQQGRRRVLGNVTATVGGLAAEVMYAGTAAGQTIGLAQINLRVPLDSKSGMLVVAVSVDGVPTQGGVVLAVE
jgi:sugar lactone lactonase YvrE